MDWTQAHEGMMDDLRRHGIHDLRVLAVMARVSRHLFVPDACLQRDAYGDYPCPIGCGQTISQPYIVAYMTERLGLTEGDRVLEIGTGSGYQAAVLAELGMEVFSIERVPELAAHAAAALAACGYHSVHLRVGDGSAGWPEEAPFAAILATCAPADVPPALPEQLGDGGRLILPLGTDWQRLVIISRKGNRFHRKEDLPVRFVPLVTP